MTRLSRLGTVLTRALILLVQTYSDVGQSCDQRTWLTIKRCPVFHISLVTYSHTNSAIKCEKIWSKWAMARFSDAFVQSSRLSDMLPLTAVPCVE